MTRLLLWGTGAKAQETMEQLQGTTDVVVGFVDSNPARHGTFHSKPVMGPEAAAALVPGTDYDLLVVASGFYREIYQRAVELGIPATSIVTPTYLHLLPQAAAMTGEQLEELASVPLWYHRFEVLPGVVTPGGCKYKPWLLAHPLLADLTGLKALDIGAWDGPYTLEMCRRGADVTAFDIQPATHSGFAAMCRVNKLNAHHICANVYNLNPQDHGIFDLVTFFGVYYHLKHPLLALANINAVLKVGGLVLVEGAILEGAAEVDPYWAEHRELIGQMADIPLGYYVKGEYEGEWSNWWVPNLLCLRHWLESSGFEVLQSGIVEDGQRGYCVARKVDEIPLEHMVLPSVPGKCVAEES